MVALRIQTISVLVCHPVDQALAISNLDAGCYEVKDKTGTLKGMLEHLENVHHPPVPFVEGLNIELLEFQRQSRSVGTRSREDSWRSTELFVGKASSSRRTRSRSLLQSNLGTSPSRQASPRSWRHYCRGNGTWQDRHFACSHPGESCSSCTAVWQCNHCLERNGCRSLRLRLKHGTRTCMLVRRRRIASVVVSFRVELL